MAARALSRIPARGAQSSRSGVGTTEVVMSISRRFNRAQQREPTRPTGGELNTHQLQGRMRIGVPSRTAIQISSISAFFTAIQPLVQSRLSYSARIRGESI